MRTPFIVGNWKMHKTVRESVDFARRLVRDLSIPTGREVAIAPAFTALSAVADVLEGSAVRLAAQNVHDRPEGAFTGEISAPMIVDAGCRYVIIGHSERRTFYGETDEAICRKIATALSFRLKPIFCIGETIDERDRDMAFPVVEKQLREGLKNLAGDDIRAVTVAYEPVWAIGTGRTATPPQAQEMHAFVRQVIDDLARDRLSPDLRILYGGSVNPGNMGALMAEADIDGALVGGASLTIESFSEIVNY
jgi:triosephosphate isomerase (TIM)